jgi:RNA 2',3'-cyclic 3'-phosphodiesterase
MSRTTRTFIAIPIPPAPGDKLARLQNLLAPQVPAARWTTTLPFHMTLAFLGDVLDTDLNAVCKAVAQACAAFAPFELRLEGVGAFPKPARPRVLWAGLRTPDPQVLEGLQKSVVHAVTNAGYRPDDQRFTPHATLARIRPDRRDPLPGDLTAILAPHQIWSGGSFKVTEVITYGSTLSADGPVYAPLARAVLTGRNNVKPQG